MTYQGSVYLSSIVKPIDRIVNQVTEKLQNLKSIKDLPCQELVSLTLNGNQKSFEVLVRRYQKQVYNIVYSMVKNHDLASDVTQETFFKVYRALDSFDRSRDFRPWLLRIARNTALNSLRKSNQEVSLDDDSVYQEPSTNKDASYELDTKLTQQTFARALSTIPDTQRDIFLLKYQQDLSYNEISEISGLSISSIKSLLFRARENLKKKIVLTESGIEETES